jgi:hypothetical protein
LCVLYIAQKISVERGHVEAQNGSFGGKDKETTQNDKSTTFCGNENWRKQEILPTMMSGGSYYKKDF